MKKFSWSFIATTLTLGAMTFAAQSVVPVPIIEMNISEPLPDPSQAASGDIAFLSDQSIAFVICNLQDTCSLEAFDIKAGRPALLGMLRGVSGYQSLVKTYDGMITLVKWNYDKKYGVSRLSADLKTEEWTEGILTVSDDGKALIESNLEKQTWIARDINTPSKVLLKGYGQLIAFSDHAAAYYFNRNVFIENIEGKQLGSFSTETSVYSAPKAIFLGKDMILFNDGRHPEIRDFNGKIIHKIHKLDGWGHLSRTTLDGERVLFDQETRHVSTKQSIAEDAMLLLTAGMAADDFAPNGEMVRVVDTNTGSTCFEWTSKDGLLLTGHHADINPSGTLVAILTHNLLTIYRLPESCTSN